MNHLKALNTLNNRYFVMRHGQSLANQQGLIVSSPDADHTTYNVESTRFTASVNAPSGNRRNQGVGFDVSVMISNSRG